MATKKTAATATSAKKTAGRSASPSSRTATKTSVKPVAEPAAKKPRHKVKVVRDSFTMPQDEYRKIAEIKDACAKAGQPVKKSEVLRAGLKALAAMTPAKMKQALAGLEKIKTGRPKNS